MDGAKISVIVPVYRKEAYLRRCVESLQRQTHRNLEILLVDDGSPDNSGAMCDAFAAGDERIRVIHKENRGVSAARNTGLDAATGDYIGFVDADDWIQPEMYETLLELMLRSGAEVGSCAVYEEQVDGALRNSSKNAPDARVLSRSEALEVVLYEEWFKAYVCDKLFARAIFDGMRFREDTIYEDAQIICQLLNRANRVAYTGKPLYVYYMTPDSITRCSFNRRQFDLLDVMRERIDFYREQCPECLRVVQYRYVYIAVGYISWARLASELRDVRVRYWREMMAFVRRHPFLPYHRHGVWMDLIQYSFGLRFYDFCRRVERGVARRWQRLKERIARAGGERQTPTQ